jgi:ribosomal protein S18 acetylase RimI-like enzyme
MIVLSDLDQRRFGHVTAKVEIGPDDDLQSLFTECAAQDVRLLIARCPTHHLHKVQEMERLGFFLADTLVYWRKDPLLPSTLPLPAGYATRPATPEDAGAIEQAAALTFAGYLGHYHADPRLDRKRCDEVYSSWAADSCRSGELATHMLLITRGKEIAGFAALRRCDAAEFDGVLFGVHPAHRGNGLLGQLMDLSQQWGIENGYQSMLYSTQITNVAAQATLSGRGFAPIRSRYTLHKWFG